LDVTEPSITLKTVGTGHVDYALRVPVGVDLKVKNGAGDIHLVSYEAQTIIIENGAGDLSLRDVRVTALIVAHGVGGIDLRDVDAQQLAESEASSASREMSRWATGSAQSSSM
jgi:DUF4097 and DUF4098 domain-containing protein YvlB